MFYSCLVYLFLPLSPLDLFPNEFCFLLWLFCCHVFIFAPYAPICYSIHCYTFLFPPIFQHLLFLSSYSIFNFFYNHFMSVFPIHLCFQLCVLPKLFHIPSYGSLKGCLIALVGLLTLRLPILGWVLTRLLRHFYLISLVYLRYPSSFVLFCFLRCPTRGLAACRYFLFKLSSRFCFLRLTYLCN